MTAHGLFPIEDPANDEVRLSLHGAFDAAAATQHRTAFEALAAGRSGRVVLDLSAVHAIDGSGVGALAFLFKRLAARGRKLVVIGVGGEVLRLLTELGLARSLGLHRPAPRRFGFLPRIGFATGV